MTQNKITIRKSLMVNGIEEIFIQYIEPKDPTEARWLADTFRELGQDLVDAKRAQDERDQEIV